MAGRLLQLLLGGWSVQGTLPDHKKYVIIIAHHTSNWDFVNALGAKLVLGVHLRFFGKHSLFVGPLGWLMRALGGIPINRGHAHQRVEQAIRAMQSQEEFILAIAPEGTRSKVKRWKSGFYYIAEGAKVPIVPVAIDYANRQIVLGEPTYTTGDKSTDFRTLHQFFLPYQPKRPELGCNGPFDPVKPDNPV
ncbi:1-acyl-sn-glycerol-3-phosphate acyltransferase [Candidatus Sororendozoicomonas aggregata]|uniref:1-acyl-sn-glycerol-3-phosphate acyltransferase n=1 Tax=Candidatus Sororendozoicomonas aggregata TaxID=3073239 RepID=UPI002ED57F2C